MTQNLRRIEVWMNGFEYNHRFSDTFNARAPRSEAVQVYVVSRVIGTSLGYRCTGMTRCAAFTAQFR